MSDELYEHILTTAEIQCTNCRDTDVEMDSDEYYSSESFYNKGWRATRFGNVYCPKCASKKIKRLKR
jgi:Zn finger protein HypA/HybF involved in hydrogenase expression